MQDMPNFLSSISCSETEVSELLSQKRSIVSIPKPSLSYAINSNCPLPFSSDQRRQRLIKKFMAAAASREGESEGGGGLGISPDFLGETAEKT